MLTLAGTASAARPSCSARRLTPLVVLATWPWMWADTLARLIEYLQFHREHAYYNMEFLGTNYNEPPMPLSYPFVMTLTTVPWTLPRSVALSRV